MTVSICFVTADTVRYKNNFRINTGMLLIFRIPFHNHIIGFFKRLVIIGARERFDFAHSPFYCLIILCPGRIIIQSSFPICIVSAKVGAICEAPERDPGLYSVLGNPRIIFRYLINQFINR